MRRTAGREGVGERDSVLSALGMDYSQLDRGHLMAWLFVWI